MNLPRLFSLLSLLVLMRPTDAGAQQIDLTGLWQDDSGGSGVYRVRQLGNRLFWIVDGTSKGSYVNFAFGEITGNTMTGKWVDLPGSPTLGSGDISLRIESNDRFVKISSSSYYGAQVWTRLGGTVSATPPKAGGQVWQYRSEQGTWTGTWTQRGTTNVFDADLRSGDLRTTIVERVTIDGRQFRSERLQSSDGYLCILDGTLQPDNRTYRGTGNCPGGPSGWRWILTVGEGQSAAFARVPADAGAWQYRSGGGAWSGTWTRRGTSDLFDVELRSGTARTYIVEKVTIDGRRFHSQRIQSSDGYLCVLDGTLDSDNRTFRGTGNCPGGPSGWTWSLTMPGPP